MQEPGKDPVQFREADYFADCVFQNKEPKTNGEEGLRDIQYVSDLWLQIATLSASQKPV